MFRVSSFVLLLVLAGCASGPSKEGRPSIPAEQVFTSLPASYTGVSFENQLEDTEEFNVFTYRNYFNGGGVGIGDFNGDGRPDVYLSANQLPNELYLNEGDFFFREVAEEAGVDGKRAWATGVAVADVNADGLLDLYVCNSGNLNGDDKANELFINQGPDADGVPTFSEEAEAYGLADEGYGTHAAFFDYDLDGDLDLYLLNNSFKPASSFGLKNIRDVRDELGGDKLFRNDNGRFVDVSESAGIFGSEIAFGLGVTVGDLDQDGYPDIYVSNDFFERDYLYINNQDGTFREVLEERMPVISLSSMGADMADVDNDGRLDLFVTDMLPESDRRVKTTSIFETWNVYQTKLRNDYHHQLMRNMLHLNDGDATFTEVGQMAGVSATDWSWGALFVDLDLDGRKDIYVANGIYKDLTDQDFIDFFASEETFEMFKENDGFNFMELLDRIPSEPIANYAFQNLGDGAFTNVAAEWGLDTPGFSNGAAYADLDLDGDLDLVVNNTNAPALVLRNNTIREQAGDAPAWVRVHLKGSAGNPFGIGAGVTVFAGETQHFLEHMPMRGFQSSVDYALTFGLADTQGIDSVRVEWPGGAVQTVSDVALRSTLTLEQANASYRDDAEQAPTTGRFFRDITAASGFEYVHKENAFADFNREPLIPKMLSTEGPTASVGDVNGDGRLDVFIGGPRDAPGKLLLQEQNNTFVEGSASVFEVDKVSEDAGSAFFDADGDGDLDLYVASGGSEFSGVAPALQDRLYLNDGRGGFTKSFGRIPRSSQSGSVVQAHDFDGDGDQDLFVGGRSVPWKYGIDPESRLLVNDGGTFTDQTEQLAPELVEIGLVTDAVWTDADQDGRTDLFVAGEWMAPTLFKNTGRGFEKSDAGLAGAEGWWNRLHLADLDGDGDQDIVAGNLGLNSRLRAAPDEPVTMHVSDFDRNGSIDQVVSVYSQGESYPLAMRGKLAGQLVFLKKRFTTYDSFAEQSVEEIFTEEELATASVKVARTFASAVFLNNGDGTYERQDLPNEAQRSPLYGLETLDVNQDGQLDIVAAGNFYGVEPQIGRMDALRGIVLLGDGTGQFTPVTARESGFWMTGQVRDLIRLGTRLVALRNDAPAVVFQQRSESGRGV